MYKKIVLFLFIMSTNVQPLFSQTDTFNMSVGTAYNSKNSLSSQNNSSINFKLGYSNRAISSQFAVNFDDSNSLNYDDSFANYQLGIANFNIGKIDRIWSFSDKSSLILSSNARPLEALSIKFKNKFDTYWFPEKANWSMELLGASTKRSYNNNNSLLFGARLVFEPTENLNFELFQTSQTGENDNKLNSSVLGTILFGNSNEGSNSNINKMAGFGVSYSVPILKNNYRFYAQAVGEDEAGSLPSCFGFMSGIEVSMLGIKHPTVTTIEFTDTRVPYSTNGFCGPNTMYNNNTYDYVNYGTVLGAPIDSESSSLDFFGKTEINKNLGINYSIKLLNINDNDYLAHPLSTKRSSGSITTLGIVWKKKNLNIGGNISYQNLLLDKKNATQGTIFNLESTINF